MIRSTSWSNAFWPPPARTARSSTISRCCSSGCADEPHSHPAIFLLDSIYQLIDSLVMDTTRDALLRNATRTVHRGGSAALNFRDLGQSVGVKSSTVHYYFPTKG